jgi:hypothetical protein
MIDYMFGNSNWAQSLPSDYDKLQVILNPTKLPTIANPYITMVFNLHELHHRSLDVFQLIQLHFGDHGSLDKNGYLV